MAMGCLDGYAYAGQRNIASGTSTFRVYIICRAGAQTTTIAATLVPLREEQQAAVRILHMEFADAIGLIEGRPHPSLG